MGTVTLRAKPQSQSADARYPTALCLGWARETLRGRKRSKASPAQLFLGCRRHCIIFQSMKNTVRNTLLAIAVFAASIAYGSVPTLNVIVSDANGKAAFKGATNAKGTFATAKLKPGNYTVQFNSPSGDIKGNYAIVVAAGTKKVSAAGVAGAKFAKGGVALKVDVAPGLNIAGQVAAELAGASKNGKKMVWIPPQLGSHQPGHWAEEGSPEAIAAKNAGNLSTDAVRRFQDSGRTPDQR